MRYFRLFMVSVALGSVVFGVSQPVRAQGVGPPDSTAASPEPTVDERLQALDQKLRILERLRELEQESAAAKAKETAAAGAGRDGFFLRSADGSFRLKFGGYLQSDGRFWFEDGTSIATNTFLFRRVRPILEGTVSKFFDFRIMPDFGEGRTVLQDAYLNINYRPEFRVQVGKFKEPVGLERLQSGASLLFVERAFPTGLLPNRDLGIQVHGDIRDGVFSYAAGVFNGVTDGGSGDTDTNDGKAFAGRLFAHPFRRSSIESLKGVGLGLAGTFERQEGALPSFKTPGQATFFTYSAGVTAGGDHSRVSPQGYYYGGPLGLLGEYAVSSQEVKKGTTVARLRNKAWQVAASYVLTGEKASYKGVSPKKSFDPGKGLWGAFEIAARYHRQLVDKDAYPAFADLTKSAQVARAWAVGLNWYFNRNAKLNLDYEQTKFDGGATGGDREDEKIFLNRFQIAF